VEPVFGQIKQGRGFRQFVLRGICKVSAEWSLICTAHNLLKLAAAQSWAIGTRFTLQPEGESAFSDIRIQFHSSHS
jgi:hypothetical protein